MVRSRKKTVRARGLGVELKELRANTGLSTTKVGQLLGWSASTISRIETGSRGVTSEEVAAMLVIYKPEPEVRDRLIQLAREVDKPGWWETGDPGLPSQLTALIGFESQASRIIDVSMLLIPGLLQTASYSQAVMLGAGIPEAIARTRVATRLGRQSALTKPNAPEYRVMIDETVLTRMIGSRAVMADQLDSLIGAAAQPNITVQIIPRDTGFHRGLDGPFVLMEFPKARTIVHLESKRSSLFLDEPEDTDVYVQNAMAIRESSLSPSDSLELMARIADEYKER
ncbi:helix-turn-helix transcriptional regulator [Nocardiopsis sp. NPDC049922]|uniref:helix-turn-helix domain-containing protein n=1 Tax=Nocardiopsis sp. NPDC049922 TaxID=3155157 RepID=UPI0033E1C599